MSNVHFDYKRYEQIQPLFIAIVCQVFMFCPCFYAQNVFSTLISLVLFWFGAYIGWAKPGQAWRGLGWPGLAKPSHIHMIMHKYMDDMEKLLISQPPFLSSTYS